MIQYGVTIEGLDKLRAALKNAPDQVVAETSKAVQKSVLTIESNSKKEAPVNKSFGGGTLRQNIRSGLITRLRGYVRAEAPYSGYVEGGTRPHEIRPVVKKALANKRTGEFFGKLVHHPGTKANPFFKRGIDASKNAIIGFFESAINTIVKNLAK